MKVTVKDCLKIGASVFALYLAVHYWPRAAELIRLVLGASVPVFLGCGIAYVVNILMRFYEERLPGKTKDFCGIRRTVSILLAFITLLAVVGLIVLLILPQLVECVRLIVAELPAFMDEVLDKIDQWGLLSDEMLAPLENIDWKNVLNQILDVIKSGLGSVMDVLVSTVSTLFSALVTGLVALIFSIYLLSGKENLGSQFHRMARRYLKDDWYRNLCYVLGVVDDCFHRYIVGQCIEAVILGSLCCFGMLLLKLPYATMISALIAFTALIPVAGAYIGAGVGAFMILTVDPWQAVVFLVFLVLLQQFEGNVIYPKVVGSSMGLPGIWVLAAVTVGGGIMGIAGMFLGVPLAAAGYRILRDDILRGEAEQASAEPAPLPETESPKPDSKP
ncbi:MAG: AI-2E family transporter [Oscillospiraceae bacterium]|nr:AI-2E family transporter [Oscillospiraceae bacterium]